MEQVEDNDILNEVPEELRNLLTENNDFILFDGGLHIRGAVLAPEWHSLRKVWIGDFALYKFFPAIKESDIPFAQDCLGVFQFINFVGFIFPSMFYRK